MKNGFTLVELLIVMVIMGTLITLALPKYQTALERGRALEGLRNAQYAAEYANAKYMSTGAWPSATEWSRFTQTDTVKSRFFNVPAINAGVVTVTRNDTDWGYSFRATISDDSLTSIVCIGESACPSLDLGSGKGTESGDNLLSRE